MTARDFATWATGYYGPYPLGQRQDIGEYLAALSAPELDELKVQMRAACPSHIGQVNGYPPDIKGMQELMPEVRKALRAHELDALEADLTRRFLPSPEQVDARQAGEADILLDWDEVMRLGRARARDLARERREEVN